jgi:hypothetical protein
MHGETVKFVNAQQARPFNIYKKTELKLLKKGALVGTNTNRGMQMLI